MSVLQKVFTFVLDHTEKRVPLRDEVGGMHIETTPTAGAEVKEGLVAMEVEETTTSDGAVAAVVTGS